ncbi:MAG TPA: type II toxin-antitoxin system VapC family toxin [Acidimicrobiales bacterium]|nr:type II toxin-antitoxin system VapC family toxin [Acidimicrobiales bacterium]
MVDASALVRALGNDELPGVVARQRLRGELLLAPELVDIEVVSAFRQLLRRAELSPHRVELALADLRSLPLRRVSHRMLTVRCWELRDNLTPYDAAYVAVAELFGVPLLTADAALARAPGVNCVIEVLP